MNCKFYQLELLQQWMQTSQNVKQQIFNNLVMVATDQPSFDVLCTDLQYFSEIEKNIVAKILKFNSSDPRDFVLDLSIILEKK